MNDLYSARYATILDALEAASASFAHDADMRSIDELPCAALRIAAASIDNAVMIMRNHIAHEAIPELREPVIFLDFDGVLNNNQWIWDHSERGFEHIDPDHIVSFLNVLIHRTKAKVVVSSAWRILHTLEQLREGLASKGFLGEIIGVTDTIGSVRGNQIARWRDANKHTGPFVILDDSTDMGLLLPWLVRTYSEFGMNSQTVDDATHLLLNQPE